MEPFFSKSPFSFGLIVLASAWVLLISSPNKLFAQGSFSVSPGVIELSLERPSTQTFILANNGASRIRLIMKPIYFPVDSKFMRAGERLDPEDDIKDDLSSSILISPRVVSLAPGQKRNIRLSVRPSNDLAPGDYRSHILVKTLKGQRGSEPLPDQNSKSMSIKLTFRQETAIAIYGTKGQKNTSLQWACAKTTEGKVALICTNESKWNFRGWASIEGLGKTKKPVKLRLISFQRTKRRYLLDLNNKTSFTLRWGLDPDLVKLGSFVCNPK